jgi:hypothetical protein
MLATTLLQDYHELRESGSTGDYPALLGNLMYRSLIDWAKNIPAAWRGYAPVGSLTDFRPATRIVGYESEDLLAVDENGAYIDSKLADASYQVSVGTYGRAFSISRKVIINDDLGYIKQQPKRFGRAAARSIAAFVSRTLLEGNGNTFDTNPLFDTTNHVNHDTGASSALSALNIQKAITALSQQTVLGNFQQVTAKWLLVPPALQWTAKQILNSALIVMAGNSTTNVPIQAGNGNPLEGALNIAIDPFLTSATAWYVLADPNDVPILDVVFLQGRDTPDLLIERPVMMNLAGGDDPYEYEFDILRYKVRYEYGGATGLWWGGYKFDGS